jgi:GNAT superfamily N-acetyltransferase
VNTEAVEGAYLRAIAEGTPAAVRARLGMTAGAAGDGTVLALSDDGHALFNRAAGFEEPVTAGLLDLIIERFGAAGASSGTFKFAPSLVPDGLCEARGLVPQPATVKVVRETGTVPDLGTDLRVGPVAAGDEEEWLRVALDPFDGSPPLLGEVLGAVFGHRSSHRFGAWDGDRLVAAGVLFVDGPTGVLKGGATLASHRSRGAQAALIAARVAAAAETGCRWVVSETAAPEPGRPVTSLNNLLRAGFVHAYDYKTLLWSNN